MRLSILAPILFCFHAHASDFESDLKRIQNQGDQIDARMKTLGFPLKGVASGNVDSDLKHPSKLFQVHGDLALRRAETGKVLDARLSNRLVVGPEGSPAIVQLNSDQGLFSNLKVLGLAKQASTEGRLYIDFDRVVFKSGKVILVKAAALDEDGAYGLSAQVLSSKALMIAGSLASSFISGYAASQQSYSQNAFGFSQSQPGARNGVLQGVAQTAADQSKKFIEDSTKEKPVLVVEPGTKVSIYLDEEVRF